MQFFQWSTVKSHRIAELPEVLQLELCERLAQAKLSKCLIDIEEALSLAQKTTEEILAILRNARSAADIL